MGSREWQLARPGSLLPTVTLPLAPAFYSHSASSLRLISRHSTRLDLIFSHRLPRAPLLKPCDPHDPASLVSSAGTMSWKRRRYSDPSSAVSANKLQSLLHSSKDHVYSQRVPLSAVALCATCRILFHRPEESSEVLVRATVFKEPSADTIARCCVCTILKRPYSISIVLDVLCSGGKLLLRKDKWRHGSFDLMFQRPDDEEKIVCRRPVMKFVQSVAGSSGPRIYCRLKRSDPTTWHSIPICPEVPKHSGDKRCFMQIQKWLQNCTQKHTLCRSAISSGSKSSLPSRLLDISSGIRLIDTRSEDLKGRKTEYATLSH